MFLDNNFTPWPMLWVLEPLFIEKSGEFTVWELYLLASLICSFGDKPSCSTVADLARWFGMSNAKLIEARNGLEKKGLITIERILATASNKQIGLSLRGRSRKGLRINRTGIKSFLGLRRFRELPDEAGNVSADQRLLQVCRSLFTGGEQSISKETVPRGGRTGMDERLQLEGKVLLAILWAKADDKGVVTGLGRADLGRLAGLSPGQVESQVAKLKRLGYVTAWVAGRSCKGLFGLGAGVLFLNAGLPETGSRPLLPKVTKVSHSDVLAQFSSLVATAESVRTLEGKLRGAVRDNGAELSQLSTYANACYDLWDKVCYFCPSDSSLPQPEEAKERDQVDLESQIEQIWHNRVRVDRVFLDAPVGAIMRYQRNRLIVYAGKLYDSGPSAVDQSPVQEEWTDLVRVIREEAVPKRIGLTETQSTWVAGLLFGIAWRLAAEAKHKVAAREEPRSEQMPSHVIRIIPADTAYGYAVEHYGHQDNGGSSA